ncbi:MAG: SpoIIE family protein phosphatase [Streptosporangiales bacterium]
MTGDTEALDRRVGVAEDVRGVFEAFPILLIGMEGSDHRVTAVNAAYRTVVGRSEIVGLPIRDVFPEVVGQQVFEMLDRVYGTGEPEAGQEWRVQVERQGGVFEDIYFDFHAAARRAEGGTPTGVVLHCSDATERVRQRHAEERQTSEAERRYERARDVILELQEALLPTALPVLPQVRVAARYLVAAQDQAADGDWFDAIPLPDGRVALAVGDVVGHGVVASAAMGQLRAVLNELLGADPELETVLARVDRFAAQNSALRAATLAVALLDPATGSLLYSLCGHPPPFVVSADGGDRFLPATGGGPLGTGQPPSTATETLAPGEVLLLYSDGLIECPGRTLQEGREALATVAADAAANRVLPTGAAPTPAERVCQLTVELLTRTGYADDVTTIAAQRLPTPLAPFMMRLANDPASLGQVREAFAGWLDDLGATADDRFGWELAAGEAVSNAIEHAYPGGEVGTVRFEAELHSDGVLECRVSDDGQWRIPDTTTITRGRGLLLCEQLLDQVRVSHPPQEAGEAPGSRGTTVTLRHRLHRPAMLASEASARPLQQPDRPAFTVEVDSTATHPAVRVSGPVDITTVEEFSRELVTASRSGVLPLTVELSSVTHLASAGVRAMHDVREQLAAHGQPLSLLAAAGSPAASVLDLVGLPFDAPVDESDVPAQAETG